jgi:hypothetical protein
MDGFSKIDIETSNTTTERKINNQPDFVNKKMSVKKNKKVKKGLFITIAILIILALVVVFAIVIPAGKVVASAKATYAQAKVTLATLKKQNVQLASEDLAKTKENLYKTKKDLDAMGYLKFIPIANWYYGDAVHLLNAGFYGLDAANILVDSVKPYADLLGLKGQGSFVMGSAEVRIQTAVKTMGKVTPKIDDIVAKLQLVKEEVDKIDANRYPSFIGGDKIRKNLDNFKNITDNGVAVISDAKPLIKVLPQLLGEPKQKKYLVIFQNDKELRPTGGFMTAYAIFRVEGGIIHVDASSDIYELDDKIGGKEATGARAYTKPLALYMPKVPLLNLRDTNLSPDFVVSMKEFNKLYARSAAPDVDGIITIDTSVLVETMKILGDITTDGTTFTTKIDPRCNCPQVIYTLEEFADQPVNYTKTNRKGIIGDLLYAIMNKAFSSSPKLYWGPLFQTILAQSSQKHILYYMYDKEAQQGIESLNAAGRIMAFDGDYFHLNEANFGGAKANLYITEAVKQEYVVNSDGSITKTVTVDYKNPFAPSDCNLERGGLCLNALLRNYIRFYVPKGSELVSYKGSEVKMTTSEDLGKTVFDGFMTVRPQGIAKVTVVYKLPFKLKSGSVLPVMIQKQPGTNDIAYDIVLNGRDIQKFTLSTDKTLELKP